jgi:aspartokinase
MSIVVQKYGGSSVADLKKIRAVAERIATTRAQGHDVVVVASAMGNTTNELLALAHQVCPTPDRRELDMLVSTGERVTMALLAMTLRSNGVPAVSLTGSQSGIVTDEAHADARVVEVRPDRVRRHLEQGETVIIAGFQGVSRAREVTTLGRGGSDTTAVVLAAALGAAWCELCSDVDGVWSADPRLVADAHRIDSLGLDEGLAMARAGAKVLFEDAVRYARDNGVVLRASSTFGPGAGTRLTTDSPARGLPVAVASDALLVRLDGLDVARAAGLAQQGARFRRFMGSSALVDVRNVHGSWTLGDGVREHPVATVSLVGSGIGETPTWLHRGEQALLGAGITPATRGGLGDAVWWEIERSEEAAAVTALHGCLVAPP